MNLVAGGTQKDGGVHAQIADGKVSFSTGAWVMGSQHHCCGRLPIARRREWAGRLREWLFQMENYAMGRFQSVAVSLLFAGSWKLLASLIMFA
eukprot:1906799-Amphidinium_carterae.1